MPSAPACQCTAIRGRALQSRSTRVVASWGLVVELIFLMGRYLLGLWE
jgi:hypothetical protein